MPTFSGRSGEIDDLTAAAKFAVPRTGQDVVFVDVGSRKIESKIVRDGLPIGIHTTVQDVLDDVVISRPTVKLTVLSQSVAPGTAVPVGTTINIVLARPGTLPIGLLQGVLTPLRETSIADGFARFVATKPQVRRILARASGGALSGADEQEVRELFLQQDISITDEPGHDLDAAVETLRVLSTFGG